MRLLLFIFIVCNTFSFAQTLELEWEIFHPEKKEWFPMGVKGSVQEALINKGELPDPFYGLNEKKFDWIENYKWEMKSAFEVTSEELKSPFIEIEFPNIDTYADVYLNGVLLFQADNAFHPYTSQIRSLLKEGKNDLKVVFTPPVLYHADQYKKEKFHLPATNDVHPSVNVAPYTRKPQYQFGWDWALRMNTIGFWKAVQIHFYSSNRIIGKNCVTQELSEKDAVMKFEVNMAVPLKGKVTWKSHLFGEKTFAVSGGNTLKREEIVMNPKLWWPRGQGEPFLYIDKWTFYNERGEKIDEKYVDFGIRKVELIIEPDQWGTSFFVKVNNRKIFCKGGDYIPQDIFPAKVEDEDLEKMVEDMAAANFNMVRIWGGGYYPDDAFYSACDEKGIMVWQDLMFACAMYPGDEAFQKNIRKEFEYQVPRIASHPSVVLFNGNNEVDVAWKNWGFQLKYVIYGDDAKLVEQWYDNVFKQLAPSVISSYTNLPYVHTSPLSNWGKDEYFNHATMHYWGVWHGKDPIEDFGKKSGRFNAEYGFQSFPEFSTLSTFSEKKDWSLESEVMKHHQKSYVGNGMIAKQTKRLYGDPINFESFVYLSQLTQSKAISIAVAGHRTGMPKCMGTLYWQVNDCWSAPTWSSIDYFGNWKKLHYTIREDYKDVAVVAKIEELGKEFYYLVSDAPRSYTTSVHYQVFQLNGKRIQEGIDTVKVEQGSVIRIAESVCKECYASAKKDKNYVIRFVWTNANGEQEERFFTHLAKKKTPEKAKESHVKKRVVSEDKENKKMIIEIENTDFVQDFWLYTLKKGVRFSTNFNDYLPGKHWIEVEYEGDLKPEDLLMMWR